MDKELRSSIHALAPFAKAVAKLADDLGAFESMEEHLIALDKKIQEVQSNFEKISKATEAAMKREQEAKINVNTYEQSAKKAIDEANAKVADMRNVAKIEIEKMYAQARREFDEYLRDLEVRKKQAGEELNKLAVLIEQRKQDHKAIEDSLTSIRRRVG